MKIIDEKYTIIHNRGDKGALRLVNDKGGFKAGDKIKFSIIENKDYQDIPFQKTFEVTEDSEEFYLTFTNEEMRFSEPISKKKKYYYEIDMNDDITLKGSDELGDKKFILYPEAVKKEGEF